MLLYQLRTPPPRFEKTVIFGILICFLGSSGLPAYLLLQNFFYNYWVTRLRQVPVFQVAGPKTRQTPELRAQTLVMIQLCLSTLVPARLITMMTLSRQ